MARHVSDATPIGARSELVEWIASGEKPRDAWRLGTEHEKVPFYRADASPVPYEGERGIRALLDGMQELTGWQPILEDGHPTGLFDEDGGGAISLEPGGQFELSGAPLQTLHETFAETAQHLAHAKAVGDRLGIGFLTLGMSPRGLYHPSMKLKSAMRASACEPKRRRSSNSHSSVAKKLSHKALSYASPTEPIEGRTPASRQRAPKPSEVYWQP